MKFGQFKYFQDADEQVLLLHDAYVYKLKIAAVILKRMQGISKFSRERDHQLLIIQQQLCQAST